MPRDFLEDEQKGEENYFLVIGGGGERRTHSDPKAVAVTEMKDGLVLPKCIVRQLGF